MTFSTLLELEPFVSRKGIIIMQIHCILPKPTKLPCFSKKSAALGSDGLTSTCRCNQNR